MGRSSFGAATLIGYHYSLIEPFSSGRAATARFDAYRTCCSFDDVTQTNLFITGNEAWETYLSWLARSWFLGHFHLQFVWPLRRRGWSRGGSWIEVTAGGVCVEYGWASGIWSPPRRAGQRPPHIRSTGPRVTRPKKGGRSADDCGGRAGPRDRAMPRLRGQGR